MTTHKAKGPGWKLPAWSFFFKAQRQRSGLDRPGPDPQFGRGLLSRPSVPAHATAAYGKRHQAIPGAGELEHRVGLVEEALHRALKAQQADLAALQVVSTEQREHNKQQYTFTTLRLPQVDSRALHERFVKELATLVPSAKLTRVGPEVWDIAIDGLPTHRLNVPAEPPARPEPPVKAAKGRVAIVIDDMGEDVRIAQGLAKLGVPGGLLHLAGERQPRYRAKAGQELRQHRHDSPAHAAQGLPGG